MATTLKTPGVYIEEKPAFPNSAVAVETAVPVFIGYTAKAQRNGKSLLYVPTKVRSLAEYVEQFGGGFRPVYDIVPAGAEDGNQETFVINDQEHLLQLKPDNQAYFYNAIRLFYANGGADCYILPVGTYGNRAAGFEVSMDDFLGSETKPNVFALLENEFEPTLIVLPDIVSLGADAYTLYTQVLMHCEKVQSRFGIFDVALQSPAERTSDVVAKFRDGIGINALKFGAAYYPWLRTSIVQPSEVDFSNIGGAAGDLENLLPEATAKEVVRTFSAIPEESLTESTLTNYHQSLKASSPTYVNILAEIRRRMNIMPPSAAMAGIYSLIDGTRGVWKSPANVSLSMVDEPLQSISHDQQQDLNVDVMAGKSINVIRPFPGIGTLVWGARTLDGNSQDWRYINVRRTLIMIEQSLKLATRTYVFDANTSATWLSVSSMINNFLFNLWKGGALAGADPSQAYDVQVGLGSTMTPTDILDGIMRITVRVAIVRPAEFIVITFQQKQQES